MHCPIHIYFCLPGYVHFKHTEALEKAAGDLIDFQKQAERVCATVSRRPLKCTKEMSGVSPDTAVARPLTKRFLASRSLDFENVIIFRIRISWLPIVYIHTRVDIYFFEGACHSWITRVSNPCQD